MQFYVVWLNQRSTDARETIDATIVEDPRVTQYWDGEGITGTYFADADLGGLGYSGFVYDVYYVFGPDASWADAPAEGPRRLLWFAGTSFLAAALAVRALLTGS